MSTAIETESYRNSYENSYQDGKLSRQLSGQKATGKNRNAVNENLGLEFDGKGE